MSKEKQLTIEIKNDELVISIGAGLLAYATFTVINEGYGKDDKNYMVVKDRSKFAQSIIEALAIEEEDGTTPVHRMLDNALEHMVEQGEITGVDYPNDPYWDGCVDE